MDPNMIKELVERKIPIYLVTIPGKGITKDCPQRLRNKELARLVLTKQILFDADQGLTDQQIIDKYESKNYVF
jgi:hypothetical protein